MSWSTTLYWALVTVLILWTVHPKLMRASFAEASRRSDASVRKFEDALSAEVRLMTRPNFDSKSLRPSMFHWLFKHWRVTSAVEWSCICKYAGSGTVTKICRHPQWGHEART